MSARLAHGIPQWFEMVGTLMRLHAEGAMGIEGDPARLGDWFAAVHDPIVARTV